MPYQYEVTTRYISLISALKRLPGVAPILSKKKIKKAMDDALMSLLESPIEKIANYIIGNSILTEQEWEHLWIEEQIPGEETIRISHCGAKILKQLYLNNDLVLKKGKSISEKTPGIDLYISQEDQYKKQMIELEKGLERRRYLINTPDEITEKDFEYELLNQVFIEKFGLTRNTHSLYLDGIKVTKSVQVYKSNSGKTYDSEIVISYINQNGEQKKLIKESIYKKNRKNDEGRNWGLSE